MEQVLFKVGEVGILAKSMGIKTGPQLLFDTLRSAEWHLLKPNSRIPYSKYVPKWFVVKSRAKDIVDSYAKRGDEVPYSPEIEKATTTYVTPAGRRYILRRLAREAGITIDEADIKPVLISRESIIEDILLKFSDEEDISKLVYRLIRHARLGKSQDVHKYVQEALRLYGKTSTSIAYEELRPVYMQLFKDGHIQKRQSRNDHLPEWFVPKKGGKKVG